MQHVLLCDRSPGAGRAQPGQQTGEAKGDALDEDDDVQNVFSNANIPDEVMAKLDA